MLNTENDSKGKLVGTSLFDATLATSPSPRIAKVDMFKVVGSCWTFSTELSDTERSKNHEKKLCHNGGKRIHLPKEV